jgi:hypothetical protein
MIGIYWIKPHFIAKFKNFPTANGEYVVTNVSINDVGTLVTTDITLETLIAEMPDSNKDETPKGDSSDIYHQVNISDRNTKVIGVEQ